MSETQMILLIVVLSLVCLILLITEIDPSKHYQKGVSDGFRKGYKACAKDYGLKDLDMSAKELVFKNGAKLTFSKHANPDSGEEGDWQGSDHDEPPKKTYQSNGVKAISVVNPNPDDEDEIDSLWLIGCGAGYGDDDYLYFDLKTCDYLLRVWYVGDGAWEYHSDSFGGGRVYTRGELRELFKDIGEPLEKK